MEVGESVCPSVCLSESVCFGFVLHSMEAHSCQEKKVNSIFKALISQIYLKGFYNLLTIQNPLTFDLDKENLPKKAF